MNRSLAKNCLTLTATLAGIAMILVWYYADALWPQQRSAQELGLLLSKHFKVRYPDGDAPFPAVILFHGCGGFEPSDERRAELAVERGYAAITLDSHTPRGIEAADNCSGRNLLGRERAADVLLAVDYAGSLLSINADALFLAGYSHGAWSILEALALGSDLPSSLTTAPQSSIESVAGIIAWYPYCGFASRFGRDWPNDIPVLMLLADADEIASPDPCLRIASAQRDANRKVTVVNYPGVSHGFDIEEDWVVKYRPEIATRALEKQYSFMRSVLSNTRGPSAQPYAD